MHSLSRILGLSSLVLVLGAPIARADEGRTRQQTHDELVAAQKSGDIVLYLGMTGRELFPSRYPQAAETASGKTRDQVRAELVAAQKSGDVVVYLGKTAREVSPAEFATSAQESRIAVRGAMPAKTGTN